MTEDGLVTVGAPGPRGRKPYTITDAGRAAFATWIDALPADDQVRVPLLLTILFSDHLRPGRLAETLATASDRVHLATLRFGILHEQEALSWFDELQALLAN